MNRRKFMLSSTVAAIGLKSGSAMTADLDAWLLEEISQDPYIRSPSLTGELSGSHYKSLYGLFLRIGEVWEMSDVSDIQEWHFRDLIVSKTSQEPSYLTEYIEAAAVVSVMTNRTGRANSAYDQLLIPPTGHQLSLKTRLGRAQKYVGSELVTWYVTQGGFKRFGYRNYRGFMGGPFTMSPPPYRLSSMT